MKVVIATVIVVISFGFSTNKQCNELKKYTIDEIYFKKDLPYGTLDDMGQQIDCIYLKTSLDAGTYDVTLKTGPNGLYNIDGTNYYVKFLSYYGYIGWGGDAGILDITGGYSDYFYKRND